MTDVRPALLALVLSLCGISGCVVSGCEAEKAAPKEAPPAPSVATHTWSAPEPVDLTNLDALTEKTFADAEFQKFPDCHLIFEPEGTLVRQFPLDDPSTRALQLAGCKPEAYHVTAEGTRFVAYAVPAEKLGWDLRLAAYADTGELAWDYRLDRSENAKNFTANFRRSFIAPLLPRLVCTGTLWEGGTQTACLEAETGKEQWAGMMRFWAGIAPQPLGSALNAATLSGLTRRYPYSGVEMRFERFAGNGGRAAYYATDNERLFFVPSEGSDIEMTAFSLSSFEPTWHLELPARPEATWEHAFGSLGVVLFKIDKVIYAADTDSGELLWAATIGDDEPSVAARGGKLYLLARRESAANLLFEVEPERGQINWYARVPTGTLEIDAIEDELILRSVRAVQRVDGLE